jgi:hypothetical protein
MEGWETGRRHWARDSFGPEGRGAHRGSLHGFALGCHISGVIADLGAPRRLALFGTGWHTFDGLLSAIS